VFLLRRKQMARSLNKKYFGSVGAVDTGGKGIASVTAPAGTLATLVNGTYSIPAASITAPQIAGGAKPTLSVVVTGAAAYTVTVVTAGSGYTSAPTITFAGSIAGGTGSASPVATLTAAVRVGTSIAPQGITSGSTNRTSNNDILRQVSGRRYKIQTQDGTLVCKLKASAPTAVGEMAIVATDAAAGTYYVTKLTAHKATLTRGTGTVYADGATVQWTLGTATATVCKLPTA